MGDDVNDIDIFGNVQQMEPSDPIEFLEKKQPLMNQLNNLLKAQDLFLTDFIVFNHEAFHIQEIMEKQFPEILNQINILHNAIEYIVKDIQKNLDITVFHDTKLDEYLQNLLKPGMIRREQDNFEFRSFIQNKNEENEMNGPETFDVFDDVEHVDVRQMEPSDGNFPSRDLIHAILWWKRHYWYWYNYPRSISGHNLEHGKNLINQLIELLSTQDLFLTDFILSNHKSFHIQEILEKQFPEILNQINFFNEEIEITVKDIQKDFEIGVFYDTKFNEYLRNLLKPGIIRRPQNNFELRSLIQNKNDENKMREETFPAIPEYEEEGICIEDMDCKPYGECNMNTQKCECVEGWEGAYCTIKKEEEKIEEHDDLEANYGGWVPIPPGFCFRYNCYKTCQMCSYLGIGGPCFTYRCKTSCHSCP